MLRLAFRGLVARRLASVLAAAGLLTAVSGFLVLAGVSRTTQTVLTGDITAAWNTPYDILVRPVGSQTAVEGDEGLVRPNFLSGLTGGITLAQLAAIRGVQDVVVAAPIAVVGFVSWPAGIPLELGRDVGPGAVSVLRISIAARGEAGRSSYPSEVARYLVVAPGGRIVRASAGQGSAATYLAVGSTKIPCSATVACYGGLTPDDASGGALAGTSPGVFLPWPEPIVVAGIDPVAEAQLAHLDGCVTSGRYLRNTDTPASTESPAGAQPQIPVLVSTRSFIDEQVSISVERATDPTAVLAGTAPGKLPDWVSASTTSSSANDAYAAYLATLQHADFYDASQHWTAGPVVYQEVGPDHLAAVVQSPDLSIYESQVVVGPGGDGAASGGAPSEASDVWFRGVVREDQVPRDELFSRWQPVGEYDPACLPGFDPLAGGRLEAYGLPSVELTNGQQLGPTRSLASYVNSPPLVLTTLAGAAWLSAPTRFAGAPGNAFISAVRIKVAGVATPGPIAQARLAAVAGAIRDATGLEVDIVKGASPRTVLVDLPAGDFGRPAVTVKEGWSEKGVATRFIEAVSGEDLALFVLVLAAALLLVGDTAYVAVRQRAPELATLRALGWSGGRLAWLVESEMLLLGLIVGAAATVVNGILHAVGVSLAPWQLAGALPLAVVAAGTAGLVPALLMLRGRPIDELEGHERARRSQPIRTVAALAVVDLVRSRRVETALGVIAVALGSALVGAVSLVAVAFNGRLDATALGVYLSAQVRPFHLVIAVLTLGVGVLAAGEIVTLGYLRRRATFATLRAIGWTVWLVQGFLVVQATSIGILGALVGALTTVVVAWALHAALASTEIAIGLTMVTTVAATALAAVGPGILAARSSLAANLRDA